MVFQNQWYVSLLLCGEEYRLLVVVVVLDEINKQTNKVIVRFPLRTFIILMPEFTLGHYAKPCVTQTHLKCS